MALSRFDRRIRIVSFRLSEREYEAYRELCVAQGLHGISDLARKAIQGWYGAGRFAAKEQSVQSSAKDAFSQRPS